MGMATPAVAPLTSGTESHFLDSARDALQQIAVLLRNSYSHNLGNQVFEEPLEKLDETLGRLLKSEGQFRLELSEEEVFANGVRLRMEIKTLHSYKYVISELRKRDIGGISFSRPSIESLSELLEVLAKVRIAPEGGIGALNAMLTERKASAIELLPERALAPVPEDDARAPDRRDRAVNAYQQALDFIRDSMMSLDSPAQVNLRKAKRTVQKLVDLSYEEGNGFSLAGMASIKEHDNYTFNHMVNVCVLAIAFGQRLGLRRHELAQLGLSALYHDMGKLHIPLNVLNNHTDLTEKEWAVMGNHTVFAARTLFPLIETDKSTVSRILTALQHHLRYDGSGYPKLRVLTRQSLYARITAIVDTFDAMTTKRLYQRQYLPDEALALLYKLAGGRYDPILVKAFVNCMGIYPIGSTVSLSSGELAVVVESNPNPDFIHQPKVRIVTDIHQKSAPPSLIDLAHPSQKRTTHSALREPQRNTPSTVRIMSAKKKASKPSLPPKFERAKRPIVWIGGSGLPGGATGKKTHRPRTSSALGARLVEGRALGSHPSARHRRCRVGTHVRDASGAPVHADRVEIHHRHGRVPASPAGAAADSGRDRWAFAVRPGARSTNQDGPRNDGRKRGFQGDRAPGSETAEESARRARPVAYIGREG